MKTTLLIAAIPAAGAFSVTPGSEPIKASDSPLFFHRQLACPSSPRTRLTRLNLWRRNNQANPAALSSSSDSKYKLQAYTVAPEDSSSNPWYNFLNFRDSVADYADSLFSLEGGDATPATRPYMPNLEVEEQLTATAAAAVASSSSETVVSTTTTTELDKEELMMELSSLSETFDDLQSRYEATIENLKEENSFLEEGMKMLAVTIEEQASQIEQLQNQNTLGGIEEEENDVDGIGAIFENKSAETDGELIQFQNKITALEADNESLKQRVRGLEVELSDVAFESRKIVAAAVEAPPAAAVVEIDAAAPIAEVNAAATEVVEEEVVVEQVKVATLSPHAPPTPIPQHLLQKQEMEMLRAQVQEYEMERNSVRKLFGRGIRRGVKKVGKVLDLWRPIFLILCDGVRGDGKMAL
jgi:predicted  nucleic acid-binding Zn-ribbon protein